MLKKVLHYTKSTFHRAPLILKPLYPFKSNYVKNWFTEDTNCVICLTIDAEGSKNRILEIFEFLEKEELRGTFFVTGKSCEKYPDLVKLIAKTHDIGWHTATHPLLFTLSQKEQKNEIINRKKVERHLGIKFFSFRGPYCGRFLPFNNDTLRILLSERIIDSTICSNPYDNLNYCLQPYPHYVSLGTKNTILEIPWTYPSDYSLLSRKISDYKALKLLKYSFGWCVIRNGVFVPIFHPLVIFRNQKASEILKELVKIMKNEKGTQFSTISDISKRFCQKVKPSENFDLSIESTLRHRITVLWKIFQLIKLGAL